MKYDLASAWVIYNEKLDDIKDILRLNASHESIQKALLSNERDVLARTLGRARKEFRLDILTVTNGQGKVILRTTRT